MFQMMLAHGMTHRGVMYNVLQSAHTNEMYGDKFLLEMLTLITIALITTCTWNFCILSGFGYKNWKFAAEMFSFLSEIFHFRGLLHSGSWPTG